MPIRIRNIRIEYIPHEKQRYETVGDWQIKDQILTVRVSKSKSNTLNFGIALHEIIEALLCTINDVSEAEVDRFDLTHLEIDEPGNDPTAPYHLEHRMANEIEEAFLEIIP